MFVQRAEIDIDCENLKLRCCRVQDTIFIEKNNIEYNGTILINKCDYDNDHFIIEIYIDHDNFAG